jgi:hypothetical protein
VHGCLRDKLGLLKATDHLLEFRESPPEFLSHRYEIQFSEFNKIERGFPCLQAWGGIASPS